MRTVLEEINQVVGLLIIISTMKGVSYRTYIDPDVGAVLAQDSDAVHRVL
jgi:hypothetical protein